MIQVTKKGNKKKEEMLKDIKSCTMMNKLQNTSWKRGIESLVGGNSRQEESYHTQKMRVMVVVIINFPSTLSLTHLLIPKPQITFIKHRQ